MFEDARKMFKKIKLAIEDKKFRQNVSEFQIAVQKLISEYDTANWENRFVVGGALEVLFCALLNSMGFECRWLKEARYDIKVNGIKFSIKGNFTGSGYIRLINILGEERVKWEEPTLFFISDIGICYADPSMNINTQHTSDALVINVKDIKDMVNHTPEWLIPLAIPYKPKGFQRIKTASYDVAKSVLDEIDSKFLKIYLPKV